MRFTLLICMCLLIVVVAPKMMSSQEVCGPASAIETLDLNDVNASLHIGGLWTNDDFNCGYLVPEDVGVWYAGNIWIGGLTTENQLVLAANRYFPGVVTDYFAGPLSNNMETSSETCELFDRFWTIDKSVCLEHLHYFDCLNDPSCEGDLEWMYPNGYNIPEMLLDYPAHGDVSLGQDFFMAPFYDYNDDGIYNPEDGDCPLFEGMVPQNDCQGCNVLKGHRCIFWIENDAGGIHTSTLSDPIGLELQRQAYAYRGDGYLDRTTFYSLKAISRRPFPVYETYIGLWADPDIGNAGDDYVGCDINRNLGYAYNGDPYDESGLGSDGYGLNPPAAGLALLKGFDEDDDGIDNDGDGTVDNETLGMTGFIAYNNSLDDNGEPTLSVDYYNYLKSIWKNGQQLSCGGDGLNPDTGADLENPTQWMYADDTYPDSDCGPWTEITANGLAGDRRFVQSSGPFTLMPNEPYCMQYAAAYARQSSENPTSVELLQMTTDTIQQLFEGCGDCFPADPSFSVFQVADNVFTFINFGYDEETMEITWNFGDGTTASGSPVSHVFEPGMEYAVSMTISNDCSSASSDVYSVDPSVGIPSTEIVNYEIIFNGTQLQIVPDHQEPYTAKILDISGRRVFEERAFGSLEIDLNRLAGGIYFVQTIDDNGSTQLTSKVYVNR